jgi:protein dithiol:quinone oxidoreductase
MKNFLCSWCSTKCLLSFIALSAAVGMLFALYLQHIVGLEPCPMCIVQRYALLLMGIAAALGLLGAARWLQAVSASLAVLLGAGGAFVAARQSWLQWHPPEFAQCGRDFYGMIETFPLQRVVPMIFKGSGDCVKIDWTFLGGSIANWSFVAFVGLSLTALLVLFKCFKHEPI